MSTGRGLEGMFTGLLKSGGGHWHHSTSHRKQWANREPNYGTHWSGELIFLYFNEKEMYLVA